MPKYFVYIPFIVSTIVMVISYIICIRYDNKRSTRTRPHSKHVTLVIYYIIYTLLALISIAIACFAWFSAIIPMSKEVSYVRLITMYYPLIYLALVSLAPYISKHFVSPNKWYYRLTYMNIPIWFFTSHGSTTIIVRL